ncbi:MAG TPA: hypothetical protein VMV20_06310, partial [Chitinophagaceae bacterium]|nr:hypothetical protein [Chitinophagaceae bacterium]
FQGKRILKHTYWYLMDFTGKEQLVPQVEEDILDIHWIAPEHLPNYLEHAHANIREVCFRAGVIANPG